MNEQTITIAEALRWASVSLSNHGNELNNGEILLMHIRKIPRSMLYQEMHQSLARDEWNQFQLGIHQINQGIPIQHITGVEFFYGREFHVSKHVLIPRPETEEMIEIFRTWRNSISHPSVQILDIGTGSGVLAITIKKEFPLDEVVAIDISNDALEVAKRNAAALAADVQFYQGDLLNALVESPISKFHCILSNPPYISQEELKTLPIRVIAHDPLVALDGGLDGLDFYRRILSDATSYLEDKGFILFEMGFQQGKSIAEIAHGQLPNGTVEILRDINQKERFVKITI